MFIYKFIKICYPICINIRTYKKGGFILQRIKNNLKKYKITYLAFGIVAIFFVILGIKYGFTQKGILTGLAEFSIIVDGTGQKTILIADKILNLLILLLACIIIIKEGLNIFKNRIYKKMDIEDDCYGDIVNSFLDLKSSRESIKNLIKILTLLILLFLYDKLSSIESIDYSMGYDMFKNISNYIVILILYYSSVSSAKVELIENIGNLKDDEIVCFTDFLNSNEDIENKKDIDELLQYIKTVKAEGDIEDKTYKMSKFRYQLTIFAFIIAITQFILTLSSL